MSIIPTGKINRNSWSTSTVFTLNLYLNVFFSIAIWHKIHLNLLIISSLERGGYETFLFHLANDQDQGTYVTKIIFLNYQWLLMLSESCGLSKSCGLNMSTTNMRWPIFYFNQIRKNILINNTPFWEASFKDPNCSWLRKYNASGFQKKKIWEEVHLWYIFYKGYDYTFK